MFSAIKKMLGISSAPPITKAMLENGTVIDVRTPAEFNGGHANGSINIPLDTIAHSADRLRKMPQPILTCCKSGMRSAMAAKALRSAGIEARNAGTWQKVEQLQNQ